MRGSEFRLYQGLGSRFPILALEVWARSFTPGLNCFFGLFGAWAKGQGLRRGRIRAPGLGHRDGGRVF